MPKGKIKTGLGIELTGDRINLVKLTKTQERIVLTAAKSVKLPVGKKEDDKKLLFGNIVKTFEGVASSHDALSLGVGGHTSFVRKVKLPPVSHSKLKQVVSFEVQQQVPFSLNEVIWDYQVISPISKVPGPVIVLIAAIKQSFVEDLLKILQGSVNRVPDVVDTSSLALHNCLIFNDLLPKEKVGILVNLGFNYTDVSIENKGEMAFTRAVPIGRKNILKKIAQLKGVDTEKAQEILEKEDVSSVTLSIWEDLVAEIKRTTNYYLSQVEKVTHFQYIYISGEFPKDANLIELLKNSFRVEVKEIDPFNKIIYKPDQLTDDAGNFCVSTGLALRALEHFPVEVNLLPSQILNKRKLSNKKLYFISSLAVLFLIGGIILVLGMRSYNLINKKINMIEPVLRDYKPYVSRVEELKNKRQSITNKLKNMEAILQQKSQLSVLLLEISRLTPTSIYITEISNGTFGSAMEGGTEIRGIGAGRGISRGKSAPSGYPTPSAQSGYPTPNTPSRYSSMNRDTSSRRPGMQSQTVETTQTVLANTIFLSGITASYPTVDEYINQLETSPLFKNVELISVTSALEGREKSRSVQPEMPTRTYRGRDSGPMSVPVPEEVDNDVQFKLEIVLNK